MQQQPRGPLAISDEQLQAETGRPSADWYVLLDAWGAPRRSHSEIVGQLRDLYGLDERWANVLAVRYETARNLQHAMSIPADLIAALVFKPQARIRFEQLSGPAQREIVGWLESSSDDAIRRLRIRETVARLVSDL